MSGHAGRDLIIIVITDGPPSDLTAEQLRQLEQVKKPNVYTTFIVANDVSQVDISTYSKPSDAYEACLKDLPGTAVTGFYSWCLRDEEIAGRTLSRDAWISKALLGGKMPHQALPAKDHPDFTHQLIHPEEDLSHIRHVVEKLAANVRAVPMLQGA